MLGAVGFVGLVGVAGCSAGAPGQNEASVVPMPQTRAPAGGQLLSDRGITHGPAHFSLPVGVTVTRTIDQPNVVTLVFPAEDATMVYDYLMLNAAALGLTDLTIGKDSLVFQVDGWDGGFTTSSQIAGLTLRRQP